MKKFIFLFILILSMISCESEEYYFDKFSGNSYECEMQGVNLMILFQGDAIIIQCNNQNQTLIQSWGSNTPDLYIFELNNFIFDITEQSDGNLKGWYYLKGNDPNSNIKVEIILYKQQ